MKQTNIILYLFIIVLCSSNSLNAFGNESWTYPQQNIYENDPNIYQPSNLNPYDNKDSEQSLNNFFSLYIKNIQHKIKEKWNPPPVGRNCTVIVAFKINREGAIVNLSIFKSSHIDEVNLAAINAVRAAGPFDPLPTNFNKNYVDVQITLDYKAIYR